MKCSKITCKLHAIEQMFNRSITQLEVETVIEQGETIAAYPNDKPCPSVLRLAFVETRPIHIVMAQDMAGECYVVTAYEPAIFLWEGASKLKRNDLPNL